VELALTVPILLLLLLGAAELARVAYAAIEVSNAAEAAVRYGAQNSTTADPENWPAIQAAAETDAANLPLTSVTPALVCGCSNGTVSGQSCTGFTISNCPGSHNVETLIVTTTANFDPLIHVQGLPTSFTLTGRAIQEVLY
jgi:Flp pilus assembly protein TadG